MDLRGWVVVVVLERRVRRDCLRGGAVGDRDEGWNDAVEGLRVL